MRARRRNVAGAVVSGVLLGALLVFAVVVQVIPLARGGSSLVVLSGSMSPALNAGDIVAVRGVEPSEVRVGDIITFQPVSDDPTLITHRVVSKGVDPQDGLVFVTRGDANSADDQPIVGAQIKGLYMYRIPAIGWVFNWMGGVGGGLVKIFAVLLLAYAVWALVIAGRRSKPPLRAAEPDESATEEGDESATLGAPVAPDGSVAADGSDALEVVDAGPHAEVAATSEQEGTV